MNSLCPIEEGQKTVTAATEVIKKKTQPLNLTGGFALSHGKCRPFCKDEALREELKQGGLGTPLPGPLL